MKISALILLCTVINFNVFCQLENVLQFSKFELDIDHNSLAYSTLINSKNAFKKEEIVLKALIYDPNGKLYEINGFYYSHYDIVNDSLQHHPHWPYLPHQKITSTSLDLWKIRFTPELIGTYYYYVSFYFPNEDLTYNVTSGQFLCTSNPNQQESFIRLNNNNNDFIYSADQSVFIPIGVNIYHYPYWNGEIKPKVNFYELYFDKLSENGCNLVRMTCDFRGALSLATVKGCNYYLDRYDMSDAFVLDKILELAEIYNMKIHLRLFGHENFTETNAWEHWNTYNIYSQMPGCTVNPHGVCNAKEDFFTSNIAKAHQNNYLRYIIDRWGYSTSIAAWEIFAEADGPVPNNLNILVDWHEEKINVIRNYDEYERPITTSFAAAVYNSTNIAYQQILSQIDYIQLHRYTNQFNNPQTDFRKILFNEIQYFRNEYNKPVLLTESGNYDISLNAYENLDKHGFAFHQSLWSNIFHGVSGPYHDWIWYAFINRSSSTHEATGYMHRLKALSKFLSNFSSLGGNNQSCYKIDPLNNDNLSVYYLKDNSSQKIFGWVQDENFLINNLIDPINQTVDEYLESLDPLKKPNRASETNSFLIPNLSSSGQFKIKWYNTETGNNIKTEYAITNQTQINLTIPFELLGSKFGDAAFIIEPTESGWIETLLAPSSMNTVLDDTDIKIGNNQLFYVRELDGRLHTIYADNNDNWIDNWINSSAPRKKHGLTYSKGLEVIPANNNEIYYTDYLGHIHKMFWTTSGWQYEPTATHEYSKARFDSELHYGNNSQLFYVQYSGKLQVLYKNGNSWEFNWVNGNAPHVKQGTGFVTVPELNNTTFYIGEDNYVYRIYWTSAGWQYHPLSTDPNSKARSDSKLIYSNGKLFYTQYSGKLQMFYMVGATWSFDWVNANAPNVKTGTGFAVDNSKLYYVGDDSNIYIVTFNSQYGYVWEKISINTSSSGGARTNHNIAVSDNQIFYVGQNDKKIYRLQFIYDIPFPIIDSNTGGLNNNRDVMECDSGDIAYGLYLPNNENISIFPNPAHNNINIYISDKHQYTIDIFDINSKLIKTIYNVKDNILLDCSDMKSGIYFFKITSSEKIYRKKVIIM